MTPESPRRRRPHVRGFFALASVWVALLTSACTTTYVVGASPAGDAAAHRFLEAEGPRRASLVTSGDSTILATALFLSPEADALTTTDWEGQRSTTPLDQVSRIEMWSPRRGVAEGMGIGLAVAGIAAGLGALLGDSDGEGGRTHSALVAGVATAVFTLPAGFVIGLGGHTYVVEFRTDIRP